MSDNFKMYLNMYSFDTVLPGSGQKLTIKPITTGQLKRMLLYETGEDLGGIEDALDMLLSECVITEGFDPKKLYLQDRFFLLLELRKITRGNTYSFTAKCTECGGQFVHNLDISKIPVKKLELKCPEHTTVTNVEKKKEVPIKVERKRANVEPEVDAPVDVVVEENPCVVTLSNKLKIELQLITREMQQLSYQIVSQRKEVSDNYKQIEAITLTSAQGIKAVITPDGVRDDKLDLQAKMFLIDNILQSDMDIIQDWFEKNDFGVDFSFKVTCPHCKKEENREVPLEDFFF